MNNKDKAIIIAIDTFLSNYIGDVIEVYNKLSNETHDDWYNIGYADVWQPFEEYTVGEVVDLMNTLIASILKSFGE